MKIDGKSFLIGALLVVVMFLFMSVAMPDAQVGRYQIAEGLRQLLRI